MCTAGRWRRRRKTRRRKTLPAESADTPAGTGSVRMVLLSDIIMSHGNILFLLLHEQTTINSVVTSLNLAMRTAAQTKESR